MPWVTIAWSMVASACLTLALLHLTVWLKDRPNRSHLFFSIAALAVTGVAAGEWMMVRSQSPQEFGLALRWTHVPLFFTVVAIVAFVRAFLGAGRWWLALTVVGLRLAVLIVNFCVWPN